MAKGTAKWFTSTKGFGVIQPENGESDIFVHKSALESAGFHGLEDGQAAIFDIEQGRDGKHSAENLKII